MSDMAPERLEDNTLLELVFAQDAQGRPWLAVMLDREPVQRVGPFADEAERERFAMRLRDQLAARPEVEFLHTGDN